MPSGGANIEIVAWASRYSGSNNGYYYQFGVKEGSSWLTSINQKNEQGEFLAHVIYRGFATAGSHTYNVSLSVGATATVSLSASATAPAFITVKLC